MRISWAAGCAALFGFALVLPGCASKADDPISKREAELGTDGKTTSTYHALARHPHGLGFMHEGFIVAVEKSPHSKVGGAKGPDSLLIDTGSDYLRANPGRREHLDRVTNGSKVMYVSHILAFEPDRSSKVAQPRMTPRFLYNLYPDAGVKTEPACMPAKDDRHEDSPYGDTWHALEILRCELRLKFDAAEARGLPYSHLVVASMGWDNDQVESVRRYNAMIGNLMRAARDDGKTDFNPLLVGFTWPSVWGSDTVFDSVQLLRKLGSYGNKSDDADEIGYTIANKVLNDIVLEMRRDYGTGGERAARASGLKVIVIGHSMGARLVTRAVFSRPLLKEPKARPDQHVDLVLGLQGAYSVNRFVAGHRLGFPFNLFRYGEGHPYSDYDRFPGTLVMTWSEDDKANPVAVLLTGAGHIGGAVGHRMSREEAKAKPFHQLRWRGLNGSAEPWQDVGDIDGPKPANCEAIKAANAETRRILLVDSTPIVGDHNDILDLSMGRFVWASIACFAS